MAGRDSRQALQRSACGAHEIEGGRPRAGLSDEDDPGSVGDHFGSPLCRASVVESDCRRRASRRSPACAWVRDRRPLKASLRPSGDHGVELVSSVAGEAPPPARGEIATSSPGTWLRREKRIRRPSAVHTGRVSAPGSHSMLPEGGPGTRLTRRAPRPSARATHTCAPRLTASFEPSGDQLGALPESTGRAGAEPSAATTIVSAHSRQKAIRVPSGDHWGWPSTPWPLVERFGRPPATETVKTSKSSLSAPAKASRRPFGDQESSEDGPWQPGEISCRRTGLPRADPRRSCSRPRCRQATRAAPRSSPAGAERADARQNRCGRSSRAVRGGRQRQADGCRETTSGRNP